MRLEAGVWKVIQWHNSSPVPNRQVFGVELTRTLDSLVASVLDGQAELKPVRSSEGTMTLIFTDVVDSTSVAEAIGDLSERTRTKKLTPDEVQGGTFTVTNPGNFGGLFGIPIINQPQVAILAIGGIQKRPVVIDDTVEIRPMVYLSLSFDHRTIDGAVADQFMAEIKQTLETWDA